MTPLERLSLYRDQLVGAQSFEEHLAAHLAWVEMLIERERADETKEKAVRGWVATLKPQVNVEIRPAPQKSE